jgi:endo-1,4-beta-xylanase
MIICSLGILVGCTAGNQPILKEVFKPYFYIGTALNYDQIMGIDYRSVRIVEKQFNSITPEDILKWENVHPQPDNYDFSAADSFVAFGERNKMFMVGHTLVWHNQTPDWVFEDASGNQVSRDTLLQRLKDHIFAVVGRYKGRINGWDVINESIDEDGTLRQSKWLKILGEEFLRKAFEWAHQADPQAELYYNDFNLWVPVKREGAVRLVRDLRSKGVPVSGIGMQGHWGLDYPPLNELEASILAYSELGVKVMITELDLRILPNPGSYTGADITRNIQLQKKLNPYPNSLPDSMQTRLADRYAELFKVLIRHSDKISRVTLWGVTDGQSWCNDWPVQGRTSYPLLFDRNYQAKPAFYAVIKTAHEAGK